MKNKREIIHKRLEGESRLMKLSHNLYITRIWVEEDTTTSKRTHKFKTQLANPYNPLTYILLLILFIYYIINGIIDSLNDFFYESKNIFTKK